MINELKFEPSQQVFQNYILSFQPFIIKNERTSEENNSIKQFYLDSLSAQDEIILDISCTNNSEEEFSGNPLKRERIQLDLKKFIEGYQAISQNKTHWLLDSGLNLYLSQCCLFSNEIARIQVKDIDTMKYRPNLLLNQQLDAINIWANIQSTKSTLHFDANHNILQILSGSKTVYLFSSYLTEYINPIHAGIETPNHSTLSFNEIDSIYNEIKDVYPKKVLKVTLQQGDLLFIPEGWWHQVYSSPLTFAINFWFESPLAKLLLNEDLTPYLLRSSLYHCTNNHLLALESKISKNEMIQNISSLLTSIQLYLALDKSHSQTFISCCSIINNYNFQSFYSEWLNSLDQNHSAVISFLSTLTPEASYTLLQQWDTFEQFNDQSYQIFDRFWEKIGEQSLEIKDHLIIQANEWRINSSENILQKIIGSRGK